MCVCVCVYERERERERDQTFYFLIAIGEIVMRRYFEELVQQVPI